jgi:tryptophan synthase beta chain
MTKGQTSYASPDERGYYGAFGGAYIPEMLHRNVEELRTRYLESSTKRNFKKNIIYCCMIMLGALRPSILQTV